MTATLSLALHRVTVEGQDGLALPAYVGPTLLGVFGQGCRALCCPARPDEECPVAESCSYHALLETTPPPDSEARRRHDAVPRPFLRFPPGTTPGIGVVRPSGRPTLGSLTMLTSQLTSALARESIHGRRWIVEPGRVRIHQSAEEKE